MFRSIEKYEFPQQTIEKLFIGKKGQDYFKENSFGNEIFSADEKNYKSVSASISDKILLPFLNGEIDQIYVAYNKFASAISQLPTITKILPIEFDDSEDVEHNPDILVEPNIDLFVETVFPKFFNLTLSSFLLEAITSEHAARTAAMDNATRNAGDLVDRLTINYNRSRQAAITKELIEIISGAESL